MSDTEERPASPGDDAAATSTAGDGEKRRKGRGMKSGGGNGAAVPGDAGAGPAPSVEGWIVFVSNVYEEAQEDDVREAFAEYGYILNLQLPLDRQTGFVKGYALVEYEQRDEGSAAIEGMNGKKLMGHKVSVDWAFTKEGRPERVVPPASRR